MRPTTSLLDRRRFLALGAACVAAPAVARGAAPTNVLDGSAFGTGWRITLPTGIPTDALRRRAEALIADLDLAFSPWRDDSVLSRFNAGGTPETSVGAEVAEVTRTALAIARESNGCFDPTVGPLVARWGFGPITHGATRPGGWRALSADDRHLRRADATLTLDLCGIAKGYALDRLAALLLDLGQDDVLIDLGGELAARGRHPSGRVWRVGIEDPRPEVDGLAGRIVLDGVSVATSGIRANGYDIGGRRYSHIIDTATREPVEVALCSVSVVGSSAQEADAWATALMAAGDDGPALARNRGIAALFLFREGGGLRHVATGGIVVDPV